MKCNFRKFFCICFFAMIIILNNNLYSQDSILDLADDTIETGSDEAPAEEKKYDFSFHGYIKTWGIVKKFDNFKYGDVDQAKINNRVQLKFEGNMSTWGHILTSMNFDLIFDAMNPKEDNFHKLTNFDVVEAYFDWYAANWLSIRVGKQFIIWGEIEGIEAPTDIVTPMNYDTETTEFEDSRVAPTALAFNFHFARNHKLEIIWLPIFTPANIPPEEIVKKGETEAFTVIPRLTPPEMNIENGEYAARLSGTISNFFKYGISFLYGFDDLPDAEINYDKGAGNLPINVSVDLINQRMMIPAVDMGFDIKDVITLKTSAALYVTEDFEGKIDEYKNSYVKYLIGVESANIFWNIYFSLYAGQMWVINYTKQHTGLMSLYGTTVTQNELPNRDMMVGYDQLYEYKWLISNTLQRTFLQGNRLELILTYALSIDPEWENADYVVNTSIGYKFTSALSLKLGGVFSNKMEVIRNYGILELKYVF